MQLIKPVVRKERLELSRREALEPKSSASTNSATFALHFRGRDYSMQKKLSQMKSISLKYLSGIQSATLTTVRPCDSPFSIFGKICGNCSKAMV
jgi:hypothetical protein